MGVDVEREGGAAVADLSHHRGRIGADGDEDRGEGVPELMGRDPFRQRQLSAIAKEMVGALEHLAEELPQIVLVPGCAVLGREGEGIRVAAAGPRLVRGEDVAEELAGTY